MTKAVYDFVWQLYEAKKISIADAEITSLFRSIDNVDYTPIELPEKTKTASSAQVSQATIGSCSTVASDTENQPKLPVNSSSQSEFAVTSDTDNEDEPKLTANRSSQSEFAVTSDTDNEDEPKLSANRSSQSEFASNESPMQSKSVDPATNDNEVRDLVRSSHPLRSRKTSEVWKHFQKESESTARCIICNKVLKHSGNTTNLTQHINRRHALLCPSVGERKRRYESSNESDDSQSKVKTMKLKSKDGPFVWSESLQGLILSSYFWGYLLTQLPGGRVAELFSARWVMNGSIILNAVASILSPWFAGLHHSLFIVMRFAQGLGGGVTFPAMHVMIAKWAPPDERSILSSIVYAGTALGTVISIVVSGLLAGNLGWAAVFYVEGALSLIWCFAWAFLVQDSPSQQTRFITQGEKDYIASSLGQTQEKAAKKKKPPVPWVQVLKSLPFWAILISHVCSNFGWYMLLTELPTFMNQILKFNMNENAALSAMPFLCMWFFTMALSKILAIIQSKGWISISVSRKIATLFASFVPMVCLIGVSYVECNRALAVFFMTIGVTCIGGMFCGFLSNHIDIAPNFAGTLVAITNTFATIPGFVVPPFVGALTEGNQTIEAWRTIFFTTVALYIIEMLVYTIFGTAEEQPWNKVDTTHEDPPEQIVPLKEKGEE